MLANLPIFSLIQSEPDIIVNILKFCDGLKAKYILGLLSENYTVKTDFDLLCGLSEEYRIAYLKGDYWKLRVYNFYDVVDLMIRGCANNERQFALKIIAPTFKSNVLHHHGRPWAAPLSISQQLFEQQFLKSNTFFDIIDGDLKLLRCRIFDYIFNECYGFDNRHDPLSAIKQLCPDAPIDNLETCSQYFFEKFGLEMR
jgi:hypothetical protein